MDQRQRIRDEIDETAEAIAEKFVILEERTGDAVHRARESVSLEHQVRRRPWAMMGVAVTCGFVLDRLLL